jgi:hypothetical protein
MLVSTLAAGTGGLTCAAAPHEVTQQGVMRTQSQGTQTAPAQGGQTPAGTHPPRLHRAPGRDEAASGYARRQTSA